MKFFLIFIILFLANSHLVAQGKPTANGKSLPLQFSKYLLSKKTATAFRRRGGCGESLRKDLRHKCCEGNGCSWEERAELSKSCGWHRTAEVTCELSLREDDRRCRCDGSRCHAKDVTDRCRCGRGKFWCWIGTKCVYDSNKCDSNNDCGNWRDEKGCSIPSGLSVALQGGIPGVAGNVLIGGRPVCDDGWNDKAARVICRRLGFSDRTEAIARSNSFFGSVSTDFRMDDVRCQGNERDLSSCDHVTSNNCGSREGAGVECVDPLTLTMKSGHRKREGFVYLGQYSVCLHNWNSRASRVVCNQLYRSEFPNSGDVPVYGEDGFSFDLGDEFVVNSLFCTGSEEFLTKCSGFATNRKQSCVGGRKAKLLCARCLSSELIAILGRIQVSNEIHDIESSIEKALKSLVESCHPWNCRTYAPSHPWYCKIKSALEDLKFVLQNGRREFLLTNNFLAVDLLKRRIVANDLTGLMNSLDGLKDHVTDFQKELAEYFVDSVEFQTAKLNSEIRDLSTLFREKVKFKNEQEEIFMFIVDVLIEASSFHNLAEKVQPVIDLALSISRSLFDPDTFLEVEEKLAAIVKMERVHFLVKLLPKFVKTCERIVKEMKTKRTGFKAFAEFLKNGEKGFTHEKARNFLTLKLKSPYEQKDLDDMKSHLEVFVDGICDLIFETKSQESEKVREKVAKSDYCLKAKSHAARLITYHEKLHQGYLDQAGYLNDFARSKLQARLTQGIASSLAISLGNNVQVEMIKLLSASILRLEKKQLIKQACNAMTYINRGEEFPACSTLKTNVDANLDPVLLFDFENDICRDSSYVQKYVNIPLSITEFGTKVYGVSINLTRVFADPTKEGHVIVDIADVDWLIKNGWLDAELAGEKGPFYLKSLEVIPPPVFKNKQFKFSLDFQIITNRVGSTVQDFQDRLVAGTDVLMNGHCGDEARPSPYDLPSCPTNGLVCSKSTSELVGPMYPSLLGSTVSFSFRLDRPVDLSEIPRPTVPLLLKTKMELCFDRRRENKRAKAERAKGSKSGICCGINGREYLKGENGRHGTCQACPGGSVSALHGYYCQEKWFNG